MLIAFCICWKNGAFSYKMIAYGGITMFLGLLLLLITYKMINNVVNSSSDFLILLQISGDYFVLGMTPLMLIMAVAVSISNISLMRHEGYRPVNALGIAASVLWILGTLFVLGFSVSPLDNPEMFNFLSQLRMIVTYVLAYFESMIISTSVCAWLASRYKPPYDKDYIQILGCAIQDDGSLTPLLRGRADSAIGFEKRQFEKTGRHAVFVPSGGQGSDEIISEGEAMKRYLMEQGIPEERILPECASTNTNQNFRLSYEVIKNSDSEAANKKIAFATTNYHIFRGYILSAKNGFRAEGISAKTKWYFFPNAFLREFIGMLYDQKIKHFIYIAVVILMVFFR